MNRIHRVTMLSALAALLAGPALSALAQGTAFTYQGDLESGGVSASGPHDLRLRLFDAASGGAAVTPQVCADNVPVADGQFTITMDFGQQFMTAAARFLEIEVRADTGLGCSSAGGFVILAPRQRITAAPFATHALTANVLAAPDGSPANALVVDNSGRVGIGTTTPSKPLHVTAEEPVMVLHDPGANATQSGYIGFWNGSFSETGWVGFGSPGSPHFTVFNGRSGGNIVLGPGASGIVTVPTGNVGMGTSAPLAKLDVRGDIRLGASGQFSAVGGAEQLRLVRGEIDGTGARVRGSGFTSTRTGEGTYQITFSPSFVATPTVIPSAIRPAGISSDRIAYIVDSSLTTAGVTVQLKFANGAFTDSDWSLCVIGPR